VSKALLLACRQPDNPPDR